MKQSHHGAWDNQTFFFSLEEVEANADDGPEGLGSTQTWLGLKSFKILSVNNTTEISVPSRTVNRTVTSGTSCYVKILCRSSSSSQYSEAKKKNTSRTRIFPVSSRRRQYVNIVTFTLKKHFIFYAGDNYLIPTHQASVSFSSHYALFYRSQ